MAIGLAKSLFGMTSTTEPTLPPSRSPLTMLPTVPLSSSHRMQDRFHLAPPARAEGSHVAPIDDGLRATGNRLDPKRRRQTSFSESRLTHAVFGTSGRGLENLTAAYCRSLLFLSVDEEGPQTAM